MKKHTYIIKYNIALDEIKLVHFLRQLHFKAKSRKYQGVFEVKSKTNYRQSPFLN